MAPLFQGRPHLGESVGAGAAAQPLLDRFQIDHGVKADIVQNGRQGRGHNHIAVRDAEELGHDEGPGPHHRGHDPARPSRRWLRRRRKSTGVNPVRIMRGIVIPPSTATLATELPLIVPKSELEKTTPLPVRPASVRRWRWRG